jgi:transposase
MSRKKQWSASTKFEIALLALKGETTLNEICKRYQVAPSLVHNWKKQLLEQGMKVFAKEDKSAGIAAREAEEKQSKLYEKIGQLTVERDFLKKVWGKFQGSRDDS